NTLRCWRDFCCLVAAPPARGETNPLIPLRKMGMQKILLAGAAAVSFAVGLASPPADASIITSLVSRTAVAGGFDYTYGATLSQDQQLDPSVSPVFFTVYDFGTTTLDGTTGALSTNWSFALNANQPTPAT